MARDPECLRCGAFVHWGPVLCESCATTVLARGPHEGSGTGMSTRLDEIRALVAQASRERLVRMWITSHDGETRVPTLQIEEGPVHDRRYRPATDVDWCLALRARDDLTFLLAQLDQATGREASLVDVLRKTVNVVDDYVRHSEANGHRVPALERIRDELRSVGWDHSARAAALLAVVSRLRRAIDEDPHVRLPGGGVDHHGRTQADVWVCRYCGAERGRQEHDRGCFWQVVRGRFGPLVATLDGNDGGGGR